MQKKTNEVTTKYTWKFWCLVISEITLIVIFILLFGLSTYISFKKENIFMVNKIREKNEFVYYLSIASLLYMSNKHF